MPWKATQSPSADSGNQPALRDQELNENRESTPSTWQKAVPDGTEAANESSAPTLSTAIPSHSREGAGKSKPDVILTRAASQKEKLGLQRPSGCV